MATDLCAVGLPTGADRNPGAGEAAALALDANTAIAPNLHLMEWRGFHTELQRAAAMAIQTGAALTLLMVEPGRPGRIGRRNGPARAAEPAGALAFLVKTAIGECGSIARYTEERLAIIMIETDLSGALDRAERIARSLSSRRNSPAGKGRLDATPAIGIAQFQDDESLGHLIQRASDALNRASTERSAIVVAERAGKVRPARTGFAHRLTLAAMPSTTEGCGEESAA